MPHPKTLIEMIALKISADYPPADGYEFIFEKQLLGTRMMPDILVVKAGRNICAVEVGYTRPEKLTAYRAMSIPDVRWYDKAGNLHADVIERHLEITVGVEPTDDCALYTLLNRIPCQGCPDVYGTDRGVPDEAEFRYVRRYGWDAYYDRQERALPFECQDVFTLVVTDYCRVWLICYCDKCGREWQADYDDLWVDLDGTPQEIGIRYGARQLAPWSEVQAIFAAYGISRNYLEGQALDLDQDRLIRSMKHSAKINANRPR